MKRRTRRHTIASGIFVLLLALGAVLGLTRGSSADPAGPSLAGPRAAAGLSVSAAGRSAAGPKVTRTHGVIVGHSYMNDVSRPLRQMRPVPFRPRLEREASANPGTGLRHGDAPDGARQTKVSPTGLRSIRIGLWP